MFSRADLGLNYLTDNSLPRVTMRVLLFLLKVQENQVMENLLSDCKIRSPVDGRPSLETHTRLQLSELQP